MSNISAKSTILVTIIIILTLLYSCGNNTSYRASIDITPDPETIVEEATETLSPTHRPSVNTSILHEFYNVEKWQNPDDWERYSKNEKRIKTEDYSIENFELIMTLEDATQYFPNSQHTVTDEDYGYLIEKTFTFDSLILMFVREMEYDESSVLFTIEVTGSDYVTPRGLRVGDDVEKLIELYGIPWYINDYEWHFLDEFSYDNYRVTVMNGEVVRIFLQATT